MDRLVALKLKSIVKILINPPIKDFLPSFSSLKSFNSSNIGWNISLIVSPRPSVESLLSIGSSKISFTSWSVIAFAISILASSLFTFCICYVLFVYPLRHFLDLFPWYAFKIKNPVFHLFWFIVENWLGCFCFKFFT